MIRRAVALILMFSFCCFALETAMADVHDGDATADEVAKLSGGAPSLSTSGTSDTPDSPERGPQHLHACHCSHAHGTLSVISAASTDEQPESVPPQGITTQIPDAVDLEVRVRPPIA